MAGTQTQPFIGYEVDNSWKIISTMNNTGSKKGAKSERIFL